MLRALFSSVSPLSSARTMPTLAFPWWCEWREGIRATEGATYATYFRGSTRLHSLGFLGGIIWMVALTCNVVASGVAGPALSYALGQGATLVAAIWGVFIWKEFRDAPAGTMPFVVLMFIGYASGLVLIGLATL